MVTHAGEDFWSRAIESAIKMQACSGAELVTAGGVRYANNADTIHGLSGYVLEVYRPGANNTGQSHISEVGIDGRLIDATIANNGSVSDLEHKMGDVWGDIQTGTLLTHY